jgi:hypothetical protein
MGLFEVDFNTQRSIHWLIFLLLLENDSPGSPDILIFKWHPLLAFLPKETRAALGKGPPIDE